MIKKYLFIAFAIISISVVSCRQDDEMVKTKNDNNLKVKVDSVENQTSSKISDSSLTGITLKDPQENATYSKLDSILISPDPYDPPKNGTHWKESDSIKPIDDVTDPPKNGTHWRKKN